MWYKLKRILLWIPKRDTQWPCPDGFHVPLSSEWTSLCWILTTTFSLASNATTMGTYLKMPKAWYRGNNGSNVYDVDTSGRYLSSSFSSLWDRYCYELRFTSSAITPEGNAERTVGKCIRAFRDAPEKPDNSWTTLYDWSGVASWAWIFWNSGKWLISISWDGTTWYTIMDKNSWATTVYNNWDTLTDANCGNVFQRGNNYAFPWTKSSTSIKTSSTQVDVTGYWPWNYYSSSTWITALPRQSSASNGNNLRWWVTQWKSVEKQARPKLITTSWIYHNATLWLISLSSDGSNWLTIADKNLWATTVYNSWDTLSEANCGKYYQWGNNYWFPFTWPTTTSGTQVNASSYWPWNYYSSSTYITWHDRWTTTNVSNLRWWDTWTNIAMQWPCANWYHAPTVAEWTDIINIWVSLWAWTSSWWNNVMTYLKLPYNWYRDYSSTPVKWQWYWYYWTATPYSTYAACYFIHGASYISTQIFDRACSCSIRPFKNSAVQPDVNRTKLY